MENQETKENLPILVLLEESKKIVALNTEHEAILNHIENELKANKYNSIVTMDNFPDMKESSLELGKISKAISRFRIDKKDSEMEDINLFDANFKSYCALIDAKQSEIKKGLEVFEAETRKQILEVCTKYLVEQYKEKDLRVEFRIIDISDMTLSKYATKTMSIAKPAKDEIDKRINEKLALQNKVDLRLSNLENICLRAEIEPLSKEYVQGFLLDDEESYNKKLDSLIQMEIKRSDEAKRKIAEEEKVKAAKEARQKLLNEQELLKKELAINYIDRIKNANLSELITINLDLKAYEDYATYELKELCHLRQLELENQNKPAPIDESLQEQHLKSIIQEPTRIGKHAPLEQILKPFDEVVEEVPVIADDGKVEKTLSIKIRVPVKATDEQIISAVIKMIKADTLPLERIEVN